MKTLLSAVVWLLFLLFADNAQHVSAQNCGGTLGGQSGTFTSPNYPNDYDNDMECVWTITTNERVFLTFTDFYIEDEYYCDYDRVSVYDGTLDDGNRLGKICDVPSGQFESSGNVMTVVFESDESYTYRGFIGEFLEFTNILTSTTGMISSPNFPSEYNNLWHSIWTIQTTRPVNFTFLDFDVEYDRDCSDDSVSVYDGSAVDGKLLTKLCGNSSDLSGPFISLGDVTTVVFHADDHHVSEGFSLEYEEISESDHALGKMWADQYVVFTGENLGTHVIKVQRDQTGAAATLDYNIVQKTAFLDDDFSTDTGLQGQVFFDVGEDEAELHIDIVQDDIYEDMELLLVTFEDMSGNNLWLGGEVSIRISDTVCGGSLEGDSGTITSPYHPSDYTNDLKCFWTIETDERVMLTFTDFAVEDEYDCGYDRVSVYDGTYVGGEKLIGLCGNQQPGSYLSTGNVMTVKFRSDGSVTDRGFSADFLKTSLECGFTLTGVSGTISSPSDPNGNYPNFADCVWTIQTAVPFHLTFTEFDIEEHPTCGWDYVEVFDGDSDQGIQLGGRLCGNSSSMSDPFISLSNMATVVFHSDEIITRGGFSLEYEEISSADLPLGTMRTDQYVLSAGENMGIAVIKVERDTTGAAATLNYNIEEKSAVFGDDFTTSLHGQLVFNAGEEEAELRIDIVQDNISEDQELLLVNFEDVSGTYLWVGGKVSVYISDILDCNDTLVGESGTFTSPNYPGNYTNDLECFWTIETNERVMLTFTDFAVEWGSYDCIWDRVSVYDGTYEDGVKLIGLCGSWSPGSYLSTGNVMTVKFRSDFSVTDRGFSADFLQTSLECGDTLTDPVGTISSPSDPQGHYPNYMHCVWKIQSWAPIRLTFTAFDVEDDYDSCSWDYVKVFDGPSDGDDLLGGFCGNATPAVVVGTQNDMTIVFHSDEVVVETGFLAAYQPDCGGNLVESTGEISAPVNPQGNYSNDIDCVWTIESSGLIQLTFSEFHLEDESTCDYDYVEVFDGGSDQDTPIGNKLCGNSLPAAVHSTGNAMTVVFHSDGSVTDTGFIANYGPLPP